MSTRLPNTQEELWTLIGLSPGGEELVNLPASVKTAIGRLVAVLYEYDHKLDEADSVASIAHQRADELEKEIDRLEKMNKMTAELEISGKAHWGMQLLEKLGNFLEQTAQSSTPMATQIVMQFADETYPAVHLWATTDEQTPTGRCVVLAEELSRLRAQVPQWTKVTEKYNLPNMGSVVLLKKANEMTVIAEYNIYHEPHTEIDPGDRYPAWISDDIYDIEPNDYWCYLPEPKQEKK